MPDPKIEPWMFRAAQDVLAEDWDERLKAICKERETGPEFNVRAMVLEAAAIIARHAPDPATVPIGPGDVVQVVEDYMPPEAYPKLMFHRDYCFVVSDIGNDEGNQWASYSPVGCRIPISKLVRIGRAAYWPDGTQVEGGGE